MVDRRASALVTGAAEGLGAAFARRLAADGHDLLLVDRKPGELEAVRRAIEASVRGVRVRALVLDLGAPEAQARLAEAVAGDAIGLAVLAAAHAYVGPIVGAPQGEVGCTVDANVRGTLAVVRAVAPGMQARRRGALLLVASNAALIGHTRTGVYGATKAFGLRLGESLWAELAPSGVVVRVVCPGAIATPALARSGARLPPWLVARPEVVVEQALAALDAPGPVVVLGRLNRAVMRALGALPRGVAVRLLDRVMRQTYPEPTPER